MWTHVEEPEPVNPDWRKSSNVRMLKRNVIIIIHLLTCLTTAVCQLQASTNIKNTIKYNNKKKIYIYIKKKEKQINQKVGFEVLTAVSRKMDVFWVVAPCSLVEVYHRFRGPCCLHHQGD
jgi:hypothetical protein